LQILQYRLARETIPRGVRVGTRFANPVNMHPGRGFRAVNTRVFLKVLRRRAHERPLPRNPLLDPLAQIKRPLNPLNDVDGLDVGATWPEQGAVGSEQGPARRGRAVVEFTPLDVQHIRSKFLATQEQFARLIGISPETLRNWETGRRRPHGPARALLRAIDADPFALARALNWEAREFQEEPEDWTDG